MVYPDEAADGIVSFQGLALKLDTADDVQEICNAIQSTPLMHTLILEGNTLGIEAAAAIGRSLESACNLKHAMLKDLFTGRLKSEVPVAVNHLMEGMKGAGAELIELDLSDNAFGPIGIKALCPFLTHQTCLQLEILRLNNNGLGIGGGSCLGPCLSELKKLRILICGRNRLENVAGSIIAQHLKKLTTLEQLEMIQNGIRSEGIIEIASALESNLNLRIVNLMDNTVLQQGAEALERAIVKLENLEILNLSDCLLKNKGCYHIVRGLAEKKSRRPLTEVLLAGNEIGPNAIDFLKSLIPKWNRIPDFLADFNSNCFGNENIDEMCDYFDEWDIRIILVDDEGEMTDQESVDGDEDDDDYEDDQNDEGHPPQYEDISDDEPEQLAPQRVQPIDLDSSIGQDLADLLSKKEVDVTVDDLCRMFVKTSIEMYDPVKQQIEPQDLNHSASLLKSAKMKSKEETETVESLMGHLGLLRREDFQKQVQPDLNGPFYALSKTINLFGDKEKQAIQTFVSMGPHGTSSSPTKDESMKQKLLNSL